MLITPSNRKIVLKILFDALWGFLFVRGFWYIFFFKFDLSGLLVLGSLCLFSTLGFMPQPCHKSSSMLENCILINLSVAEDI